MKNTVTSSRSKIRKNKSQVILDAAVSVFLSLGFSAATTDLIQKEAGVSKATLYNCFPNKEALFAVVIEEVCRRFQQELKSIDFNVDDISDTLHRIAKAYLTLILEPNYLALYRVVVAEAPRFPNLAKTFYDAGPQLTINLVTSQIEEAAANNQLSLGDVSAKQAAIQYISLLRGEGHNECIFHPNRAPQEEQIRVWAANAANTFLRAFKC